MNTYYVPCCDSVSSFFQTHKSQDNEIGCNNYYILVLNCERNINDTICKSIKSSRYVALQVAENAFCIYLPVVDPMYFLAKQIVCACEDIKAKIKSDRNQFFIMRLDYTTGYRFPAFSPIHTSKVFVFDEINDYYMKK